jgi:hypothetical protein
MQTLKIPLPPLAIQEQIVSTIAEEEKIIDANKRLIELMTKKIDEVIARIYQELRESRIIGNGYAKELVFISLTSIESTRRIVRTNQKKNDLFSQKQCKFNEKVTLFKI